MELSREEVQHIATLCRIGMTDEELGRLRAQLSHILEQFEVLRQVDTEGVPPTGHLMLQESVLREDSPAPSAPQEGVLSNAPSREGELFRVKAVLEE
ncbi:MAG: Asp-tRNA(Asn)/Glu-tRNA(Gln) amidotransferase subunit GatC [Dehalococcoidia bacterium]